MTGVPPDDDAPEVVCLGESMVTFLPTRPGRLADVPSFERAIGGAESNVACALAAAGHRARWVGRVGRDGFGTHLTEAIGAYGVDVSAVVRDPDRPTGVYFRTATDRATDAHEVVYHRAGSAASAMAPDTVPYATVAAGRILHLTGITAALSAPCLALVRALTAPRPGRPLVSFDVNFRPGLWPDPAAGGRLLLDLARGADLVFVGTDEAEAAWGIADPAAIRRALPEPAVLVVKRGAQGATVYERRPAETAEAAEPGSGRGAAAGAEAGPGVGPGAGPELGTGPGPETGTDRSVAPGQQPGGDPAPGLGQQPGGGPAAGARLRSGTGPEFRAERSAGTGPQPGTRPQSGPGAEVGAAAEPGTAPAPAGGLSGGGDTVTHVPAPRVDVVAPVGAGDAFAAGFLSGTLRGLDAKGRLRHGHLMAAAALTVPGDLAIPARRAHADRLAAAEDEAWERLHLGPGWTGEDQEVRTP